jgi:hypothetical protein
MQYMGVFLHASLEVNWITQIDRKTNILMQRVLLVIQTNTYFTGLFPLGMMLKRSKTFRPVFLFGDYPTIQNDIEICNQNDLECILSSEVFTSPNSESFHRYSFFNDVQGHHLKLRKIFCVFIQKVIIKVAYRFASLMGINLEIYYLLKNQILEYRKFLRKERVSLVAMAADNRYDQSVIIKASHLENIRVIILPQYMASSLEWLEFVRENPKHQCNTRGNVLIGLLYPRWVAKYKGKKLIALPGEQVLAQERLNIAPPLPWILHSGYSDAIALESEAACKFGISLGLPPEKMIVTGSITLDLIATILSKLLKEREKLFKRSNLKSNQPIILSALPPDSLYMGRPECDFVDYSDLVEFWCRALASITTYNSLIVLHPSACYEEFKYIEAFGVKIVRGPTAIMIPMCDIFVSSVSATIQWAIACGKPVINYDVYRYRYIDYNCADGVIRTEEKSGFLNTLKKLTSDSKYYNEISDKQKAIAREWGILDGKAGERLINLFESLLK